MLAQWGGGWRVSAAATATCKTRHVPDGHAQLSHHEMKSVSIGSSARIGGLRLYTELNIGFKALETMVVTLEYRKVCARWAPRMLRQEYKKHRMQVCRDLLTNTRLKVTVSWIASPPVTRRDVTTTCRSQNGSPWSGDMWILHRRKSSRRCPQRVKWCALSFGTGKRWSFWISLNPAKPSTLTATSRR